MNVLEEKKRVRGAMDRSLSGLKEDPFLAQRIINKSKGGQPAMKKKLSVGVMFAMLAVLATVTVLAAGLVFSPRYDAQRLALQALKDQYGITDEMMTIVHRGEVEERADGSRVIEYSSLEQLIAKQVGVYTVTVKNGVAHAVWSHDGEEMAHGIEAEVWGAEQLALFCSDRYSEVYAVLNRLAQTTALPTDMPQGDGGAELTVEEVQALIRQQEEAWEQNKARAEAMAKIGIEEARALAVSAIAGEFGLSASQCAQLVHYDDLYGESYGFIDDQPVVDMTFHLNQTRDGSFTTKDGIYVVAVNMITGVIEDVLYDSGRAANG